MPLDLDPNNNPVPHCDNWLMFPSPQHHMDCFPAARPPDTDTWTLRGEGDFKHKKPCWVCDIDDQSYTRLTNVCVGHGEEEEASLKCGRCRFCVGDTQAVYYHVRYDHEEKFTACQSCQIGFEDINKMADHLLYHLVGETNKLREEATCEDAYCRVQGALVATDDVHDMRDESCLYGERWRLSSHQQQAVRVRELRCSYCLMTFNSRCQMRRHERMVHTRRQVCQCPQCWDVFPWENHLERHLRRIHHRLKPFTCIYCREVFDDLRSLQQHLTKTEIGTNKTCGKTYSVHTDPRRRTAAPQTKPPHAARPPGATQQLGGANPPVNQMGGASTPSNKVGRTHPPIETSGASPSNELGQTCIRVQVGEPCTSSMVGGAYPPSPIGGANTPRHMGGVYPSTNVGGANHPREVGRANHQGQVGGAYPSKSVGGVNPPHEVGGANPLGEMGGVNPLGEMGGVNPLGKVGGANHPGEVGGANHLGEVGGANALGEVGGANHPGEVGGARVSEPLVCHFCGLVLKTPNTLKRHLHKHETLGELTCMRCSKSCETRALLLEHVQDHERKRTESKPVVITCHICGIDLASKNAHTRHMKKHDGLDPLTCVFCHLRCLDDVSLSQHLKIHTDEKRFVCYICQQNFISEGALTQHLKKNPTVHTSKEPKTRKDAKKVKDYKCQLCQKAFSSVKRLEVHIKSDTHKLRCGDCGEVFLTRGLLEDHVESVHRAEAEQQCEICCKQFTSREAYDRHLESHVVGGQLVFYT